MPSDIRDDDDRSKLSRMLDIAGSGLDGCNDAELSSVLSLELGTSIVDTIAKSGLVHAQDIAAIAAHAAPPIASFRDLFHHPAPPTELLEIVKNYAKLCRAKDAHGPSGEVSTVLYFLSIAVAQAKHGKRITEMDDAGVLAGVTWVLQKQWVDRETKSLLILRRD